MFREDCRSRSSRGESGGGLTPRCGENARSRSGASSWYGAKSAMVCGFGYAECEENSGEDGTLTSWSLTGFQLDTRRYVL